LSSKISSRKAKGRKLQNEVVSFLSTSFPSLEPDDIKPAIMGQQGEDIILSPAARKLIPYSFECKNQERLDLWGSLRQAAENAGEYTPVLIFTRNRTATYAVIPVEEFMELINEIV
jgi:hypothetical protein